MNLENSLEQIKLSKYEPIGATEREDKGGWVAYGDNNLYPKYLIELYYNSPTHNALVNRIVQMIEGQGSNSAILNESLRGFAFDLKLQGQFVAEVIWSLDGTRVAKINHLPFENCRLAYAKDSDDVTGIWYSRDWAKIRQDKYKPKFIPAFNPSLSKDVPRQVIYKRLATAGSLWYGKPDYYGGLNYVELSHQMGVYHINNILNGLFPSFIINQMNGVPDAEQRAIIMREWEARLSGAQNAGKFIMTFNEPNQQAPNIVPFPISDADKQYEFLSEETGKQIMVAHGVTSPLLFGIRDNTGFGSNKEEMETALEIFNHQVIRPYQRLIENTFEAIIPNVSIALNSPFEVGQPTPITQSSDEKKKVVVACSSETPEFTAETEDAWLNYLSDKAEYIDESEWELISEEDVTEPHNEKEYFGTFLSVRGYANPDEKSQWGDKGLYKLRYQYSQNISENSRKFCKEMVRYSEGGALFRYEDITKMSDNGVNGEFAPEGESNYDIFVWKGGAYCHHMWKRKIFMRKREKGKFLPNEGMKNEKPVGNNPYVPQKGAEGIAPINTPTRGSLKYS